MRKHLYLFLSLLVMSSMLLGSCQTSAPTEVESTEQPTTQAGTGSDVQPTMATTMEAVEIPGTGADYPDGTDLQILQWSHFVPQYDVWFDPFARAWGDDKNVNVTVDHIQLGELPASLTAAIDAGDGPTLVEMVFAPPQFIEGLHDLTELNMQAQELFGEQAETSKMSSYLPATGTYYGFSPGWTPDPANYDISMWTEVGYPNGPSTYADLLDGGAKIKEQLGIPLGLGMSPELDSRLAMRNVLWSFGASVQDANECVVINTPETLEAVQFVSDLYNSAMTEEVFAWNPASNNQGLIAGELSYILNSISAYRSLQEIDPEAADNIGFGPALTGPRGDQHASAHVWSVYVIPNYVEGPELEAAQEFLLHLTANYNQAVFNSKLYNFPAFPSTVPELDGWLAQDPFGSRPANKLEVLSTAWETTAWIGYPGPANPAVGEVFGTNVIVTMMAEAARGEKTPEQAIADAETQINAIFDKWRDAGLVGCN
ncbi:MAG: extracellular solute-binding protein [Chloroflexi bacterium]|nr:MAG: extracellular solute-binding protein [Chloroflexota bacterium]